MTMYEWQQPFEGTPQIRTDAERAAIRDIFTGFIGRIMVEYPHLVNETPMTQMLRTIAAQDPRQPFIMVVRDQSGYADPYRIDIRGGHVETGFEGSRYRLHEGEVRRRDFKPLGMAGLPEFGKDMPRVPNDGLVLDVLQNHQESANMDRNFGFNDQPIGIPEMEGLERFVQAALDLEVD